MRWAQPEMTPRPGAQRAPTRSRNNRLATGNYAASLRPCSRRKGQVRAECIPLQMPDDRRTDQPAMAGDEDAGVRCKVSRHGTASVPAPCRRTAAAVPAAPGPCRGPPSSGPARQNPRSPASAGRRGPCRHRREMRHLGRPEITPVFGRHAMCQKGQPRNDGIRLSHSR